VIALEDFGDRAGFAGRFCAFDRRTDLSRFVEFARGGVEGFALEVAHEGDIRAAPLDDPNARKHDNSSVGEPGI